MKTLSEVITFFEAQPQAYSEYDRLSLNDVWSSSKEVEQNAIFVCVSGAHVHGITYWKQAVEQGAKLILVDEDTVETHPAQVALTEAKKKSESLTRPEQPFFKVLLVKKLHHKLPKFLDWFYASPSHKLKVIGVTGTNGKTSTTFFIANMIAKLTGLETKVAMMGTLGNGVLGALKPSVNTTMETVSLYRTMAEFVSNGVEYLIMEVSSHALALERIAGIRFEGVALTQVSRDHLDFHQTEARYRLEKRKLFKEYVSRFAVLNVDDEVGKSLNQEIIKAEKIITYSPYERNKADLMVSNERLELDGIQVELNKYSLHFDLLGRFQIENMVCAIAVLQGLGFEVDRYSDHVSEIESPKGRMSIVARDPLVLIDYAHTPDGLEAMLLSIRHHISKTTNVRLVFGCGGDRDQGKRPKMGAIAEQYADQVILTDDNPRNERSATILDEIEQGMVGNPDRISDRKSAIFHALRMAEKDDVVVIAGKGHETYQEIQNVRKYYSDFDVVNLFYENKG